MSLDVMCLYMFILTGKDVRDQWNKVFLDELPSVGPEEVLRLWQALVQLTAGKVVSVLFQFVHSAVENRVLLFTLENEQLLVCNGVGSDCLFVQNLPDVITWLDWWANVEDSYVLKEAPEGFCKLFHCLPDSKSVHLFTETHDVVENTNLRLAHFQALCKAAEFIY